MANFVANLISRQRGRHFLLKGLWRAKTPGLFYDQLSGSVRRYGGVTMNTNSLFSPAALEGHACAGDLEAQIELQPLLF